MHPTDETLLFFALNRTDPITRFRTARHLRACAACRAAANGFERVVHAAAPATPPPPSRTMLPRRALIGGLATASIAAGTLLMLPGSPVQPTPTFAQVERAMDSVRTVSWTTTLTSRGNRILEQRFDADLQRGLLASAETGQARTHSVDDGVLLRSVRRLPDNPTDYYVMRSRIAQEAMAAPPTGETSARNALRRAVLFPRDSAASDGPAWQSDIPIENGMRWTVKRTPWKSRRDQLDDREALRFDSDVEQTLHSVLPDTSPARYHWTVWVDPRSYRMIRREITEPGAAFRRIDSDFRYDAAPLRSVFAIPDPAVGEAYVYHDFTRSFQASAAQERAVRALVERAEKAWNRADPTFLRRDWEFASDARSRERQRHWASRIAQGVPYRTFHIVKMEKSTQFTDTRPKVRRSLSDPFPPRANTHRFLANAVVAVPGKPGDYRITFSIVAPPSGLKISHMNMYTNPIEPPSDQATRK